MQKFILQKKNQIAIISFILITIGFIFKFVFKNNLIFDITLIVASIIGVLPILISAYQALRVKVVSIDLLVTIAVLGAFIIKNYEEAAIVTFLFLFGSYLEQRTITKTRSAIKDLIDMQPEKALKDINNEFVLVDIEDVEIGDVLLVRTGDKVPVDGKVILGDAHINEASITGESLPVRKTIGKNVFAGTILENGTLQIKAEKVGEETTFGKIIELVEEAQDSKSETERFIDKFSKWYTPLVLIIGLIVGLITKDVSLAVTILVLGCPGALVIGVPVSNVAGIGNGAKNGVLLKGSEVINDFSNTDIIVFDKTGTLTTGNMEVAEYKEYNTDNNKMSYLVSIEKESDHPLAKAIVNYAKNIKTYDVKNTVVHKGCGITAYVNEKDVAVGNINLMKEVNAKLTNEIIEDIKLLEETGNSIVLTAINNEIVSLIGIKDQIRSDVKDAIINFKQLGVKELIVLSGDNQGTVDLVAQELGLTKAFGNMFPEDKVNYLKKLQTEGYIVAFVGDGINDAPSLALADIGIAIGSGTDVAIETSDVVLMNSNFNTLTHALGLTKAIKRNMRQNIIIALAVVLLLFMGLLFGEWLNMSIGMLVHEGSILLVILNGMRLIRYKLRKRKI